VCAHRIHPALIAYRGSTGEVKVNKIIGSANSVTFSTVWQGNWGTGHSHIKPISHNGAVHVIRYKQSTGAVSFDGFAGAQGFVHMGDTSWTKTWTTISPFTLGSRGYLLIYKPSGLAKILKLNAPGNDVTATYEAGWTPGLG